MKIGLISDSHGDKAAIEDVLAAMGHVDLILHAGDCIADTGYVEILTDAEVVAVKGNCDMGAKGLTERIIDAKGKKILLTHGHRYRVKHDLQRLYYHALEIGVDIVVFGHTHVATQFEESGIVFINPGSISLPRPGKKATYGLICIEDNAVIAKVVEF